MSGLTPVHGMSVAEQLRWLHSLRPRIVAIRFIQDRAELPAALGDVVAALGPDVETGVEAFDWHHRPRPSALSVTVPYDRSLVRAMEAGGGFFQVKEDGRRSRVEPTALEDTDVHFHDIHSTVIGAVVAHEGLVLR